MEEIVVKKEYNFYGIVKCLWCNHIWYSKKIPHPIRCPKCKKFLCDNKAKKEAKEMFNNPYHNKYMYLWLKRDSEPDFTEYYEKLKKDDLII